MTLQEVMRIPKDDLPEALYEAKLHPQRVFYVQMEENRRASTWEPHLRWDHCKQFITQFKIRITPTPYLRGSQLWELTPLFEENKDQLSFTVVFEEIPEFLCRIALAIYYKAI